MAGGPGKGGQEGGSNSEWTYFIFVALLVLVTWLLWTFARGSIVYPAFALDWVQIKGIQILRMLTGSGLGEGGRKSLQIVEGVFDGTYSPYDINRATFFSIRTGVGEQTRWVTAALTVALCVLVAFRMKGAGYKRTFSLGGGKGQPPSLALYAAENWEVATFSANFDPDGREKAVEPAATPLEWLRDNKIRFEDSTLDREGAQAVFESQVGPAWHGVKRAELRVQAILVLSMVHAMRDKNAYSYRGQIARAWSAGGDGRAVTKAIVDRFLADDSVVKRIDRLCGKHAYTNPAVFAMIDAARKKAGLLAPADFLWIRPQDRNLWYTVNNVGRKRFHVEAAGSISHFFAERVVGSPLPEPHVDEAINGVEDYMAEQGIMSIEAFFKKKEEM